MLVSAILVLRKTLHPPLLYLEILIVKTGVDLRIFIAFALASPLRTPYLTPPIQKVIRHDRVLTSLPVRHIRTTLLLTYTSIVRGLQNPPVTQRSIP